MRDKTFSVELGRRDGATLAPYFISLGEHRAPSSPKPPLDPSSPLPTRCRQSQHLAAPCYVSAHGSVSPPLPLQSSPPPNNGAAKPTSSNVPLGKPIKHHASNHQLETTMWVLRRGYRTGASIWPEATERRTKPFRILWLGEWDCWPRPGQRLRFKVNIQIGLEENGNMSWGIWESRRDAMADGSCSNPDFLVNMSASADVLAQAKVEIDLAAIPEGKNVRSSLLTSSKLATIPTTLTMLREIGNRQMARQARLHPPPHPRRDQSRRRHKMGNITGPATRL